MAVLTKFNRVHFMQFRMTIQWTSFWSLLKIFNKTSPQIKETHNLRLNKIKWLPGEAFKFQKSYQPHENTVR